MEKSADENYNEVVNDSGAVDTLRMWEAISKTPSATAVFLVEFLLVQKHQIRRHTSKLLC